MHPEKQKPKPKQDSLKRITLHTNDVKIGHTAMSVHLTNHKHYKTDKRGNFLISNLLISPHSSKPMNSSVSYVKWNFFFLCSG